MKKSFIILIVLLTIALFTGFAETSKQALTEVNFLRLISQKLFYSKNIGFEGRDGSGLFKNSINQMEPGSLYITKVGIIHKGKTNLLIQWKKIKSIDRDRLAGSSSAIRIRTFQSSEKLKLTDPTYTGNMNTLNTSMDTLLRRLKKSFKEHGKNQITLPKAIAEGIKLPKQLPPPPKPQAAPKTPKAPEPPATKEIKEGMTFKEVEAILGPPLKKVVLSKKTIYKYADMVLTFTEGKMTDAQVK